MKTLDLHVPGVPRTKGSWIPIAATEGHVVMKGSNKDEKAWHQAVAWMAKAEMLKTGFRIIGKPKGVSMRLVFVMPRPSKPMNEFPRGDIDKLTRSVLDALTGIAYEDDVQVDSLFVSKDYVEGDGPVGVSISLEHT